MFGFLFKLLKKRTRLIKPTNLENLSKHETNRHDKFLVMKLRLETSLSIYSSLITSKKTPDQKNLASITSFPYTFSFSLSKWKLGIIENLRVQGSLKIVEKEFLHSEKGKCVKMINRWLLCYHEKHLCETSKQMLGWGGGGGGQMFA